MNSPPSITPFPLVTYGQLEDLLEEARRDRDEGKTVQAIRVSTSFRTRTTSLGEERTSIYVVVTSLVIEDGERHFFAQYGLWSWLIDFYAEMNGAALTERSRHDAVQFTEKVVEALHTIIEQEIGNRIPAKKGMYTLDQNLIEVSGTTNLLTLPILRNLVHPPQDTLAHQVWLTAGEIVVLGVMSNEHTFSELDGDQSSLDSDKRVQMISPDAITIWLQFPLSLDVAIAAKKEGEYPSYRVLYTPEQGWIG